MAARRCAVLNCETIGGKMFTFPQLAADEARLQKWISAVGNPHLLTLPRDKLRNRAVCMKHFEEKYILQHKLSKAAVPTQYLPEPIAVPHIHEEEINTCQSHAHNIQQEDNAQDSQDENQNYLGVIVNAEEDSRMPHASILQKMKGSILETFNVKGKKKLTMRDRRIYTTICSLKTVIRRSQRRQHSVQQRLLEAERQLQTGMWDNIDLMEEPAKGFFLSHIRNMGKKTFARKYTLDDKLFALSLYKKSPKCYRYIAQGFCLPSVETIRKVAKNINLGPGLCENIFHILKDRVSNFEDEREACCILVFDEMKLEPSLTLNSSTDRVEGFVDNGSERISAIADHVMVWMLKGIYGEHPWKQPVAYMFCKGTSPPNNIKRFYKEIIEKSQAAGLRIVASICDQGVTNCKAIQELIFESKRDFFQTCGCSTDDTIVINGDKIIAMYDPPHLLKCIRNNLLTKDLEFSLDNNEKQVAKWSHIETAYYIDRDSGPLRTMCKLTDEHVVPGKVKKMKVSKCTQVFSNTVASIISLMSRTEVKSKCGSMQMPVEGQATAHLLLFLNNLFDSVNGGTSKNSSKHGLKSKISVAGPCEHVEIWNKAISVFQDMTFIPRKMKDRKRPAVLKNWVHTLRGFKLLRESLYNLGFTDFATRSFNQDCIENFFGQVRQHGVRNVNPTCTAFTGYYKSLIFNAFVSSSSSRGNCEDAGKCRSLIELKSFLNYPARLSLNDACGALPEFPIDYPIFDNLSETAYICMDIFLKTSGITHYIQNCHVCLQNIMLNDDPVVTEHEQISSAVSAYNRFLIKTMTKLTHVCNFYLPKICHFDGLSRKLKHYILQNTSFYFVKCEHAQELENFIIVNYVDFFIRQYLMNVRKILSGSHTSLVNIENTNVLLHAAL